MAGLNIDPQRVQVTTVGGSVPQPSRRVVMEGASNATMGGDQLALKGNQLASKPGNDVESALKKALILSKQAAGTAEIEARVELLNRADSEIVQTVIPQIASREKLLKLAMEADRRGWPQARNAAIDKLTKRIRSHDEAAKLCRDLSEHFTQKETISHPNGNFVKRSWPSQMTLTPFYKALGLSRDISQAETIINMIPDSVGGPSDQERLVLKRLKKNAETDYHRDLLASFKGRDLEREQIAVIDGYFDKIQGDIDRLRAYGNKVSTKLYEKEAPAARARDEQEERKRDRQFIKSLSN